MARVKIEFTLRGPRVTKCRKYPALVGRVFPWAGVIIRQIQGGGHLFIPLLDRPGETLMAMLEPHEAPLAQRARRRHIKLAAADGSLDLRYAVQSDPRVKSPAWQFAVFLAGWWAFGVWGYISTIHQPYGWPPIGSGSPVPHGVLFQSGALIAVCLLFPFFMLWMISRIRRRPYLTRLAFDHICISRFPREDERIDLEDIEGIALKTDRRAHISLIDGTTIRACLSSVINVDAIRCMKDAFAVDDFGASTQATLYVLLRAIGIGAVFCVLAIIGLLLSGVQVPGQVYAMMALPPFITLAVMGIGYVMNRGFERGSGRWAKYKRSRKRALRRL